MLLLQCCKNLSYAELDLDALCMLAAHPWHDMPEMHGLTKAYVLLSRMRSGLAATAGGSCLTQRCRTPDLGLGKDGCLYNAVTDVSHLLSYGG